MKSLKKLLLLKLAVISLFALFAVLIALGQVFGNDVLTIAGLMAFTAAAALMTYYMVLTQP